MLHRKDMALPLGTRFYRHAPGRAGLPLEDGNRRAKTRPVADQLMCRLLALIDVAVILGAAGTAFTQVLGDAADAMLAGYMTVSALGTLLAVNLFNIAGMYRNDITQYPWRTVRRLIGCWTLVAAILVTAGFLTGVSDEYSRVWALSWFGSVIALLLPTRLLFFALTRRWVSEGRTGRHVAIVGDPDLAKHISAHFRSHPENGVHAVGLFSDRPRESGAKREVDGNLDALIGTIRETPVDHVIIALPGDAGARIAAIRRKLGTVPVDVSLCPGDYALHLADADVNFFAGLPTLSVMNRPLDPWEHALKEIEDRVIGTAIVALIAPVLLLIAIAVKLDSPGPVLFRQKRRGYNNRIIEVLKFRTMYAEQSDHAGTQLTRKNDPRVTRLGAFLRRTSLDELPQFINVLRGDMSIVGPRPHALASKAAGTYYEDAVPNYDARHRVKPGITGLAQIEGWRGPTETVRQIRKRVEHDLLYIEQWSLWLDIKIIALTAIKGFRSQNAF